MIQINKELKYNGGFTSEEAVLKINNYTVNQFKQFGSTTGATTNTVINFNLYKDLTAYEAGEQPVMPVQFPFNISIASGLTDSTIYGAVARYLNNTDYPAVILTGTTI